MGKVLFVSEHDMERAENLRAVWDAYDGDKEFKRGIWQMRTAPQDGFSAVVCDSLPAFMTDKGDCKSIVINHSVIGKKYALDESRSGIDKQAFQQIDATICASTALKPIIAGWFDLSQDDVHATGFPRTDRLVGSHKGDGGTFLADYRRVYFYAPTYRGNDDNGWLPFIDWRKLARMLEDDEIIVVKRHYFQGHPLIACGVDKVYEIEPHHASTPYIIDCDVVLTDYSSIFVDAHLAGKPVVLVVDDKNEYCGTRGMYLDYPNDYSDRTITAEGNESALLDMLREAAQYGITKAEQRSIELVSDMCDGHSTERVCDLIRGMA